jgi:hypothetical protein
MTSLQELKKTGKLKDGTIAVLRPMAKTDHRLVGDFFGRLSPAVLQYVRNDVKDPQVLDKWFAQLDYNKVFPLQAHSALAMFKKAGFSPRAVIEGLMKNRHGEDLDVVIMVMDVAAYAGRI